MDKLNILQKENAELKRQLEERRRNEAIYGRHNHCLNFNEMLTAKNYQTVCHEHICWCVDNGIDPLIAFPVPEGWEPEDAE